MEKAALVVGGTSGLGLQLALGLVPMYKVTVTGRKDPQDSRLSFAYLDINPRESLSQKLDAVVSNSRHLDLLVYAAGFYQEGKIDILSDEEITKMAYVGFNAPVMLLQRILKRQQSLPGFIAITSTSQWTPRLLEPVYTGVKAGLGMLASSLSLDSRIEKTLVVAPAGMATEFWAGTGRDMTSMLDPAWVAKQILNQYPGAFAYKFVRLLREPLRVEVGDVR
ncbi:SDR family NAD(P)-dependent oxidoreductase [Candidatus Peregrinibacteria bacterium]|nr:SDR family NAD(P)-dependent oxidoreductase [Candidatus Peregrinibacteria bacterium]